MDMKKKLLELLQEKTVFNSLSANPTKWPNTFKQFVSKFLTNCLSVFDHFVKLALKGLNFSALANRIKLRQVP